MLCVQVYVHTTGTLSSSNTARDGLHYFVCDVNVWRLGESSLILSKVFSSFLGFVTYVSKFISEDKGKLPVFLLKNRIVSAFLYEVLIRSLLTSPRLNFFLFSFIQNDFHCVLRPKRCAFLTGAGFYYKGNFIWKRKKKRLLTLSPMLTAAVSESWITTCILTYDPKKPCVLFDTSAKTSFLINY